MAVNIHLVGSSKCNRLLLHLAVHHHSMREVRPSIVDKHKVGVAVVAVHYVVVNILVVYSKNIEFALAIQLYGNIYVRGFALGIFQQLVECVVLAQNVRITYHQQMQTGSCHSHIQLAVNHHSVLLENIVCQEV